MVLDNTPDNKLTPTGLETCGGDSFLIRNSVCDEATNNDVCLFDGGDCCLEVKDRRYCQDCSCIQKVESQKLQQQFRDLEIKPLKNPVDYGDIIVKDIVKVEEVVSNAVCAVLCLDHQKKDEINAWRYFENDQLCHCGLVAEFQCTSSFVNANWHLNDTLEDLNTTNNTAFIQLGKTVPCGELSLR